MTGTPWTRGDTPIGPGGPSIAAHLKVVAAAHAQAAIARYEEDSDLGHVFSCFHAGASAEAMLKAIIATRNIDNLVDKSLTEPKRNEALSRIRTATDAAQVRSITGEHAAKEALGNGHAGLARPILGARNVAAHLGLGTRRESSQAIALLEQIRATLGPELGQAAGEFWGLAAKAQLIQAERLKAIYRVVDSAKANWISLGSPRRTDDWVDSDLPMEMYARGPWTCDACNEEGDLFYSFWDQTDEEREVSDWTGVAFADRFQCPVCELELTASDLMLLHPEWDDTSYFELGGEWT